MEETKKALNISKVIFQISIAHLAHLTNVPMKFQFGNEFMINAHLQFKVGTH